MKDLNKLFRIAKSNLDSIGIEYGNIVGIFPNTRAKSRWGQCKIVNGTSIYEWYDKEFEINISSRILVDEINDDKVISVIIHEILHTCEGCFNHGAKWKEYADLVNDCFSCYKIERTQSCEFFGFNAREERAKISTYKVQCGNCKNEFYRNRLFNLKTCTCGKCHKRNWNVWKNEGNGSYKFYTRAVAYEFQN